MAAGLSECEQLADDRACVGDAIMPASESEMHVAGRYAEVREALSDPSRFSARQALGPSAGRRVAMLAAGMNAVQIRQLALPSSLVCAEGKQHLALRRVALRGLSPKVIRGIETTITAAADELAEALDTGPPIEFLGAFARPLTTRVLAIALSVTTEHYGDFARWVDAMTAVSRAEDLTRHLLNEHASNAEEFSYFLVRRCRSLREYPDGSPLSMMVAASSFRDDELVKICHAMVVAAHNPLSTLLAAIVSAVAADPALQIKVRGDPARWVPKLVEEVLRCYPPLQNAYRTAVCDTMLSGSPVGAGRHVRLRLSAANRDAAVFNNANLIDLNRTASPDHFSFGLGLHSCIGSVLARTTSVNAIRVLLRRFTGMESHNGLPNSGESAYGQQRFFVAFSANHC
jgi:cytochrome P450